MKTRIIISLFSKVSRENWGREKWERKTENKIIVCKIMEHRNSGTLVNHGIQEGRCQKDAHLCQMLLREQKGKL